MTTVESYTTAKIDELIGATVVNAEVIADELVFTKEDGTTINLGAVGGGVTKVNAFPSGATDGDMVVREDQPGDPLYKFSDGAWELQPRMGALTVPAARLQMTADHAASIPQNTFRPVSFDIAAFDTNGLYNAASPSRLTIKTPGLYLIEGSIVWRAADNNLNQRRALIRVNGAGDGFNGTVLDDAAVSAQPDDVGVTVKSVARLVAGDYVELVGWNSATGAVGTKGNERTHLSVTWIGGAGQTIDERGVSAARITRAGTPFPIPQATTTIVPFNTVDYDTDGEWSSATPSRLTVKNPGLYHCNAQVELDANGSGAIRALYIFKNGALYKMQELAPLGGGDNTTIHLGFADMAAAGDYYEMAIWQNSGGSLNVAVSGGGRNASLALTMVGSGKTVTPLVQATKSANQNVPTGVVTTLSWDVESKDNDNIHDTLTNNTRFVCRTPGVYVLTGKQFWGGSVNGSTRELSFQVTRAIGGTESVFSDQMPQGPSIIQEISAIFELAVGDYVEMLAYQDSGISLTSRYEFSRFTMVKVGAPNNGSVGVDPVEGSHIVGGAGEPAFQSGYSNYGGGGYSTAQFYKDRGRVYLRGTISNAASNANSSATPIFILPVGYRPNEIIGVVMNANNAFGLLRVLPTGEVFIAVGNTSFASIDGISFRI